MAIMKGLEGVDVSVCVDGEPLHEYIDDEAEQEDNTVERYIESQSDQRFAIRIKVDKATEFLGNGLSFHVKVDGILIEQALWKESLVQRKGQEVFFVSAIQIDETRCRPLCFSALETVDDLRILEDEGEKVKSLGTISVDVFHRLVGKRSGKQATFNTSSNDTFVSEKALKGRAISHSMRFDDSIPRKASHTRRTKRIGDAYCFRFHYRSKTCLKSMCIIERTPTPVLLEDRDPTSLSVEEVSELQRRAREQQSSSGKLKREHADDNPRPRKVARPTASSILLEIDDDDTVRELSTDAFDPTQREVIEID